MTYWKDKMAVVTGGSSGLGYEIAKALVRRNAKVGLVARDRGRLERARDELGENAFVFTADLTDQAAVDQLQVDVAQQVGHVDVLVNCAGKSARGEVLKTTPEEFQQLFELNFLGLVRCTRVFMPMLLESRGHVVNIGSLASKSVARYLGAYPATKYPVAAYSQQLRLELASKGVHVLLACPGPIARHDAGQRYGTADVPAAARKPGGGVKLKGLDPTRLANRILLGCERKELELVLPRRARMLFVLSQVYPRLGDWLISRLTTE